jgi:hypothetical protein
MKAMKGCADSFEELKDEAYQLLEQGRAESVLE